MTGDTIPVITAFSHDLPLPHVSPGAATITAVGLIHRGEPAFTPEALMRARYRAYALGDVAYVKTSWHADTRPVTPTLPGGDRWPGLAVIDSSEGGDSGSSELPR